MSSKSISRRNLLGATAITVAGGTALGASMAVAAPRANQWHEHVDVLIAGAGAAGVSAAIEARQRGAKVWVLEKLALTGGSSSLSGGVVYMGGSTPLQKALGIHDTTEAMYEYIVRSSAIHQQLDKIQLYCEESLELYDWLVEQGVKYKKAFTDVKGLPVGDESLYFSGNENGWPYRRDILVAPRGHVPGLPGQTGGRHIMEVLTGKAKKIGVKFITRAEVLELVEQSDGSIAGAVVQTTDGLRRIQAKKGVILSCGGFIHNRNMAKLYAPELFDCTVPWGRAGDLGQGIQMGISVGAAAVRMHQGFAIMPLYQPENVLRGIVVNREGQRYIAEDCYHAFLGHETAFNQEGQGFLITDKHSDYAMDDYRLKRIISADTLEQLERDGGFPKETLVSTVKFYNRHAVRGEDPRFGKLPEYLAPLRTPPYSIYDLNVKKAFYAAHTFGGLFTNVKSQVQKPSNEIIPGLYAAGRNTWGLPSAPYIASGISLGDCIFFGRIAGREAAQA